MGMHDWLACLLFSVSSGRYVTPYALLVLQCSSIQQFSKFIVIRCLHFSSTIIMMILMKLGIIKLLLQFTKCLQQSSIIESLTSHRLILLTIIDAMLEFDLIRH